MKVDTRKVIWMTDLLFMESVQCRVFVEGFLNHIPIIMKNNPITVLQPERFMCVLLPYLRWLFSNNARGIFEGSHVLDNMYYLKPLKVGWGR